MYRTAEGRSVDSIKHWLGVSSECLAALNATGRHESAHFHALPLLSTRLLQLGAYASAMSALPAVGVAATALQKKADGLSERAAALSASMDMHQPLPRSARAAHAMSLALQRHSLCSRSGRPLNCTGGSATAAGTCRAARPPQPNASMHAHLHLTHHGGTTLLGIILRDTCSLITPRCAAITYVDSPPTWNVCWGGEMMAAKQRQLEAKLVALTANASARNGHCCSARCGGHEPAYAQGNEPIDVAFFEPALPIGAPVESDQIVWTTIMRHPVPFALAHGFIPEFMLSSWVGHVQRSHLPHSAAYCDLPSLKPLRRARRLLKASSNHLNDTAALPIHLQDDCTRPQRFNFTRAELTHAKELALSFAGIALLEEYNEGLSAFCKLLGWPTCPKVASKQLGGHHAEHHGIANMMRTYGYGPEVLADFVDAAQLSTELYYFGRELYRAQQLRLGLPPPSPGLIPPAER